MLTIIFKTEIAFTHSPIFLTLLGLTLFRLRPILVFPEAAQRFVFFYLSSQYGILVLFTSCQLSHVLPLKYIQQQSISPIIATLVK